jgi:5-methylcytosine-specific restriction endonuclease McrBC GTP-binding regulatory subunit McrB
LWENNEKNNFFDGNFNHAGNVGIPLMKDFWKFQDEYIVQNPESNFKNYILIIDEINRANLPSVLGELIYALEYRNKPVESMYSVDGENTIVLPPNLYIIGTMNTADRSVGHIDYAIRRRFAFVDVLPSKEPIREAGLEAFRKVSSLFIKNFDTIDRTNPKLEASEHLASDFRPEDIWLGHSYFITKEDISEANGLTEEDQLKMKLKFEIVPILKEYLKDGILLESDTVKTIINELVS